MASTPVTVNASLNFSPQSLNAAGRQVQTAFGNINLPTKGLNQFNNSLGRITGQASEFDKSLNAATARVFAFGAAVSIINGISASFKALVSSTIEVEKRLIEINSIFGATTKEFAKFRTEIFAVAKNTGQTFDTVASGAAELARQGLSAAETAKRLNASLILTRVSGLDAVSSVEALTAAINGFTSAGLSAEQIINKIIAVDTAFAVSAKDLADGFQRAGSTAEDAGVSFDELLGLITSVQQKTARGGAVIGNAFKSIFTRLSRSTTISELQALGVEIDASQTGVQKLEALSKSLDKISDPGKASKIKELAGGVFQINVVSAALKDLSSETSLFAAATQKAGTASNEAFSKNEALNESLAAQFNALVQSVTDLGSKIGSLSIAPILKDLVSAGSFLADSLNKIFDPESGSLLAKGLLGSIAKFLSGPGLVIVATAFFKLFKVVGKFAAAGLKDVFKIGTESEKIAQIEQGIVALLSQDEALRNTIASSTATQAQKEKAIIDAIRKENALLQTQQAIVKSLASTARSAGVAAFSATGGFTNKKGRKGFAAGFQEEEAMARYFGADSGVKAKRSKGTISGRKFIMNNRETEIPNFGRNGDSAVIPSYANGYVPNFSKKFGLPEDPISDFKTREAAKAAGYNAHQVSQHFGAAPKPEPKPKPKKGSSNNLIIDTKGSVGAVSLFNKLPTEVSSISSNIFGTSGLSRETSSQIKAAAEKANSGFKVTKNSRVSLSGLRTGTLDKGLAFDEGANRKLVDRTFAPGMRAYTEKLFEGTGFKGNDLSQLESAVAAKTKAGSDMFTSSVEGSIFETGVRLATKGIEGISAFSGGASEQNAFDFEERGPASSRFKKAFKLDRTVVKADAKRTLERKAVLSIIKKIFNDRSTNPLTSSRTSIRNVAAGYIPNFEASGLKESIGRELTGTGVKSSQVRVGQDKKFAGSKNPSGLVVTNTRDEPRGIADIPNFAKKDSEGFLSGGGLGLGFIFSELAFGAQIVAEKFNSAAQGVEALEEKQEKLKEKIEEATEAQDTAAVEKYNTELNKLVETTRKMSEEANKFSSTTALLTSAASSLAFALPQLKGLTSALGGLKQRLSRFSNTQAFTGKGVGPTFANKGKLTSNLGRLGGVSAAAGIGVAIGTALEKTFDISGRISGINDREEFSGNITENISILRSRELAKGLQRNSQYLQNLNKVIAENTFTIKTSSSVQGLSAGQRLSNNFLQGGLKSNASLSNALASVANSGRDLTPDQKREELKRRQSLKRSDIKNSLAETFSDVAKQIPEAVSSKTTGNIAAQQKKAIQAAFPGLAKLSSSRQQSALKSLSSGKDERGVAARAILDLNKQGAAINSGGRGVQAKFLELTSNVENTLSRIDGGGFGGEAAGNLLESQIKELEDFALTIDPDGNLSNGIRESISDGAKGFSAMMEERIVQDAQLKLEAAQKEKQAQQQFVDKLKASFTDNVSGLGGKFKSGLDLSGRLGITDPTAIRRIISKGGADVNSTINSDAFQTGSRALLRNFDPDIAEALATRNGEGVLKLAGQANSEIGRGSGRGSAVQDIANFFKKVESGTIGANEFVSGRISAVEGTRTLQEQRDSGRFEGKQLEFVNKFLEAINQQLFNQTKIGALNVGFEQKTLAAAGKKEGDIRNEIGADAKALADKNVALANQGALAIKTTTENIKNNLAASGTALVDALNDITARLKRIEGADGVGQDALKPK